MEEQKYFTPKIEDLFIGYECEWYGQFTRKLIKGIKWQPFKIISSNSISPTTIKNLRTPYLTKEQIENEGWQFTQQIGNTLFFKKKDFELTFCDNYININNFGEYDLGYWGQCKDINTFRYICKLLEI